MFKVSFYPIIVFSLLFGGIFFMDAYAYLDPGSGSILIQALIGALVGVGVAIKVYWEKIKYKFSMMRSSKSEND